MIVYNVTVNIDESIVDDWLTWMQEIHIPEVMKTGVFIKSQLNRVIVQGDTGETYAIAYTCTSMKDLHLYQINFAPELQQKHMARYGDRAVAFRTLMEVIKEY
tara:strand:- start:1009 stop:1317 length:309 start_codon:yes stop_codon:yes gene_type:complete